MIIRAAKWPNRRMPTHKGGVMVDTYNGALRVRAWPKPRGKAKTPAEQNRQDKFRQIQKAYDYVDPAIALWLREQTEGTPLMPRDVLTAMLYNRLANFQLPDGKVLYPMPTYQDVSAALDAITQTEGDMLVRGPNGWEAGQGGGGNAPQIIASVSITAPVPQIVVTDIEGYSQLALYGKNLSNSASAYQAVRFSIDNGASFISTNGQYRRIGNFNVESNQTEFFLGNNTASGGMYSWLQMGPFLPSAPLFGQRNLTNVVQVFDQPADPINAFQLRPSTGNFNGGQLIVLGW